MKRIVKMIIVCMAITAVPAMAVERTGNDIRIDCSNLIESESSESLSKEKVLGVGYCIGMIDGLVTFNYVYETVLETRGDASMVQMCLPERVSTRQLAGVSELREAAAVRPGTGGSGSGHCISMRSRGKQR